MRPSPTSFSVFSGICAVPRQSQTMIETAASPIEIIVAAHQWNVAKMNTAPVKTAAIIGIKLGPGTRRHCSGSPSSTEVIRVSRFISWASGR